MGSVNSRDGKLYLDFRFKGVRCREQTRLAESAANRVKLERVLKMIEQQISLNTFDYAHHFPDSPRIAKFRQIAQLEAQKAQGATMLFSVFAQQ
jgi:integrase